VGLSEASAIAAELDGIELERPMTHQLACSLLQRAGARVARIEITDCVDGVFHARVHLVCDTAEGIVREEVQEARPSDALALALHTGAEVRVAKHLFGNLRAEGTQPGCEVGFGTDSPDSREEQEFPEVLARSASLERLDEAAFGKWKM
jgi:bifunctional DNase/RNase